MANEKRLIDANALRKKAIWGKIRQGTVYESDAKVVTTGTIDTTPTVDAVEVVHGRWVERYPLFLECSKCGTGYVRYEFIEKANYCPNCGAKMDGGTDNGNT